MKVVICDDTDYHQGCYIRKLRRGSYPEAYEIPDDYKPGTYEVVVNVRDEAVALYDHHSQMLDGVTSLLNTIYNAEMEQREALYYSPLLS